MAETFFEELKRYVRFGPADEEALHALAPHARPHFKEIADEFYDRLGEHDAARAVFTGPDQVARLHSTLQVWMELLFTGPWDETYYEKRARIGRVHVRISLPQRYMFTAMDVIRISLARITQGAFAKDDPLRLRVIAALHKIIDLELAIMLETYRESFVDKVQHLERLERNLLERRLAISEARYEEIVEKGEALIVTFSQDGGIMVFNRRTEELSGLSRGAAVGQSFFELFVPEAERHAVRAQVERAARGERVPPFEGPVGQAGRRVRWHLTTLPSGSGLPLLCAMGVDITEEHELGVRTRRAERLASLGTMAAGLAHEIRNPLNAAHLQLTLLQRRLGRQPAPDVDGARGAAGLAAGEMKRLAALVEEFLQFARPQPLRLLAADLRATVRTVVDLMVPEAQEAGIALTVEAPASVKAEIDDEKIKQVLINLIRNAMEAVGRGGIVHVLLQQGDGEARIDVLDDGPGLPAPDAPIFEPFFTTKEGGTGLGLAIVHRIVSDHAGRVSVESRPGRTVFSVVLPASS